MNVLENKEQGKRTPIYVMSDNTPSVSIIGLTRGDFDRLIGLEEHENYHNGVNHWYKTFVVIGDGQYLSLSFETTEPPKNKQDEITIEVWRFQDEPNNQPDSIPTETNSL